VTLFFFLIQSPNEQQVNILIALCDNAKEDKILVQCIGTLGCLAQSQGAIGANLVSAFFEFGGGCINNTGLFLQLRNGISNAPGNFAIPLRCPNNRYILDATSVLGGTDLASCIVAY
jgi:hypothetical protein